MNCKTCNVAMTGRKRKYCSIQCRPSYTKPKTVRLSECLLCGAAINKGRLAGNPQKYCSKKCNDKHKSIQLRESRPRFDRECVICQKPFTTKRPSQHACSKQCSRERSRLTSFAAIEKKKKERPDFKIQTCKWCDGELAIPSNFAGVIKYHEECRTPARKAQYRIKSIRRQGVKAGNVISHDFIAARDGYVCYLCQKVVDMTLLRTSRYGATLDHIVPLSKGGTDTEDNVRLAHWICNIRKSNLTLEEYRAKSR